jgi:chromosome segregation ATPase
VYRNFSAHISDLFVSEEYIAGLSMANEQLRKIREHQAIYGISKEESPVKEVTQVVDAGLVAERDQALRKINEAERKIQGLESTAKDLEETVHGLRELLATKEEEIQNLREQLQRLPTPMEQVPQTQALDLSTEIEALKKEVTQKEAEVAMVYKELEKLDQYCKTLEENVTSFHELFSQVQASAQELKCPGCGSAVPFPIS